jgi:D-beta-D-heptose 7-phosphate kinase/D-beta-D-heptose 1-phosphate adenosyltransferase
MTREKVVTVPKLAEKFKKARREGLKTVFTNGCFDILHAGHILFLEEARSLGDLLAVGLNTDRSVRQIKGPSRPITPENERAVVVSALEPVDFVCLFDEPTPLKLIKALKPHFLVKGQDWREKGVVGREEVEGWGGEVILLPLEEGMSTTGIIQKIRES